MFSDILPSKIVTEWNNVYTDNLRAFIVTYHQALPLFIYKMEQFIWDVFELF